jgi:anti-sigma B factor antagonist
MSQDIQIAISHKDDIAVISIKGDVTAVTGDEIGNAYQADTISNSLKIMLEFDKDCYINSGGLASLINIASQSRKKKQKIHAYGLSDHFQKIFHMVGLTRCIPIFTSEEDAIKQF